MNPVCAPRASASGRPVWGWSLLLFSTLLLSPAAATAVMHAWAQDSVAVAERGALASTPRRSTDDTLQAAPDDAPEAAPQSHPEPAPRIAQAPPQPPSPSRPTDTSPAFERDHPAVAAPLPDSRSPRAPPA